MSDTPTPSQAEKAIREALEAGPTPGPWIIATSNSWRRIVTQHRMESVCEPITQNDGHPDLYFRNGGADGPDARLIAACNPEAMTALLSQLAEMRAEVERLKSVITEHNAECINQCEARKAAGTTQCPMKGYRRNCSDCPRDGMVDAALAAEGKDGAHG